MDLQRQILRHLRDEGLTAKHGDLRPFLKKCGVPETEISMALNELNATKLIHDLYQDSAYEWKMGRPNPSGGTFNLDDFNINLRINTSGLEYLRRAEQMEQSTELMRKQSKAFWFVFYFGAIGGIVAIVHVLIDLFLK